MRKIALLLSLLYAVSMIHATSVYIDITKRNKQEIILDISLINRMRYFFKSDIDKKEAPLIIPNKDTFNKKILLTIKQIQYKLEHKQMLLEYFSDKKYYYCLSATSKDIKLKRCGSITEIDSMLRLNQISVNSKYYDKKLGLQIAERLLPEQLSKSLIILPCEGLYALSFDVLHDPETKDFLILRHDIEYAFSVASYFYYKPIDKKTNILGFFPNTDNTTLAKLNTKAEEQALSAMPDYRGFKDAAATKVIFTQQCSSASILHIATHTLRDDFDTTQTNMLFSSNNKDYKLSTKEIQKLKLNTQLVTLASCSSNNAIKENKVSSDNLTWAFHAAGAHHILSSIGDAPDLSSSKIMCSFYINIEAGLTEAEALRLAKVTYLKNTDAMGAQPYFWSNYTLYGDQTNVLLSSKNNILFRVAIIIGLVFCFSAFKIYRKG